MFFRVSHSSNSWVKLCHFPKKRTNLTDRGEVPFPDDPVWDLGSRGKWAPPYEDILRNNVI